MAKEHEKEPSNRGARAPGTPLASLWRTRGIEPEALLVDRKGTLVPRRAPAGPTGEPGLKADADPMLAALGDAPDTADTVFAPSAPPSLDGSEPMLTYPATGPNGERVEEPDFELGELLGQGGMGVVKRGRQLVLARDVAVKAVRPDATFEGAARQLLLEARVTGALEHPNVVPIHAVLRDGDERPLVIMKRIEGRAWSELLRELPRAPREAWERALGRQLEILMQVARAVHFAHVKGVVHRDLKPENVMIGAFGEVYVLDWGIAVSCSDDGIPGLPRAHEVHELAGTPSYMAPEMAAADGRNIGPRTDVYLLGAVLHEICAGSPPHVGADLLAVLEQAFQSEPRSYPAGVPAGLVAICRRAMSFSPEERYADAGEFAQALSDYGLHRSSTLLSDEASERLAAFERELELERDGASAEALRAGEESAPRRERAQRVRTLWSECRFGFTQALRIWEGNEAARSGLRRATERMVAFELEHGAPAAAEALLAELADAPETLAAEVAAALAAERARRVALEELAHDVDATVGEALRKKLTLWASLAWAFGCIGVGVLGRHEVVLLGHRGFALVTGTFALFFVLIGRLARASMLANAASRRMTLTAILIFTSYTALWLTAPLLELSLPATSAVSMLMGSALWATLAFIERAWIGMAVGLALGVAAILVWPRFNFEAMGLAGLCGGLLTSALRRMFEDRRERRNAEAR